MKAIPGNLGGLASGPSRSSAAAVGATIDIPSAGTFAGSGPQFPAATDLRAVYRIVYYFNLFDYPVKSREIASLSGLALDAVLAYVQELVAVDLVEVIGDYVVVRSRSWTIATRESGESFFRAHYDRIRRAAWVLSHMPFVRGVFLTGRCSKGMLSDSDDFDFLIVSKKDRARLTWILLFLFRRLVSFNYRNGNFRFFCCNYVLGEDVLSVQDRDEFIAMETVFAHPVFNRQLFEEFRKANDWHRQFFHARDGTLPDDLCVRARWGILQRLLEIPFDLVWTEGVKRRVEEYYRRRWLKLGIVRDEKDLLQKAGNNYVKPDTGSRRRFIVDRARKLDPAEHNSFLRTKINLHRGLTSHANTPQMLLTFAGDGPAAREPSLARWLCERGFRVELHEPGGGDGLTRLFRHIRAHFVPLVGIHVPGVSRRNTRQMIHLIHSIGARVVVWGPDVSAHPAVYLEQEADVVITGPEKPALLALLEHITRGTIALEAVPGIQIVGMEKSPSEAPASAS